LAMLAIEGYWNLHRDSPLKRSAPDAWLWRWQDVHPRLVAATKLVNLDGDSERRSLRLCTPNMSWKTTTETLTAAIQMVMPGEVARAHRHSAAALRFVIEGQGGYTTIEGERYMMAPADLILTPQFTWHDHGNISDVPVVWLDVLDVPFLRKLNAMTFENYNAPFQEVIKSEGYARRHMGAVRAGGSVPRRGGDPFHYSGSDVLAVLRETSSDEDPFDGITIEYRNPLTGGPTQPTHLCRLHRLAAGRAMGRHRHNWNTICHVIEGRGETTAGDKTLRWSAHDTFSLPAWLWHSHTAYGGDAILFSVSDEPIFRAFALDRMETAPS
jgi:gentisate 1,2-dioxygenase